MVPVMLVAVATLSAELLPAVPVAPVAPLAPAGPAGPAEPVVPLHPAVTMPRSRIAVTNTRRSKNIARFAVAHGISSPL
jgi:hypothetical protein